MTTSARATKSYSFFAEHSTDTLWKCPFYIYKGDFGRFEAWNPKLHSNIPKQLGSFSSNDYIISDITVNGVSMILNGQPSGITINRGSSSGIDLTFANPVSSNSEVIVVLKNSKLYIPWIPYKDRSEFYYAPRRGMIDWDALPCDSLKLKQYINMEFGSISNWNGVLPVNYLGVMTNIANSLLATDEELKGRGIVSIIKNNSNTGTALYNQDGELLTPSPTEVIKYKYETRWGRVVLDPANLFAMASPSIITISECLTAQYFLLKYHTLYINPFLSNIDNEIFQLTNLKHYILFPYLIYGDFGIKTETLNKPFRFPRYSADKPITDIDLSYRSSFFNLSNDSPKVPSIVDRLTALSKLDATTIRLNSKASPNEYTNGIIDEFNFLNSRIKINKLIKLTNIKLSSGPLSKIENYTIPELNSTSSVERKELEEEVIKVLEKDYSFNIGQTNEFLDKIEVIVIAESNCNKNFSKFTNDRSYTINGKLVDSRWLLAVKDILKVSGGSIDSSADPNSEFTFSNTRTTDSILNYERLWEFMGFSKKTQDIILEYALNNLDKICTFIIVRGIDDDNLAEAVLKERTQDYIMMEPLENVTYDAIKPSNERTITWNLSDSEEDKIPIININGRIDSDSEVKLEGLNYLTIFLKKTQEDTLLQSDDEYYEISRKVILPNKPVFNFNIFEDLLCPLRVLSDNVSCVFNPPEIGPLEEIKVSINGTEKKIIVPPYEFDLSSESINSSNKPTSLSYDFQIIYDDNKILPFSPSSSDPSIPDPNSLGWVAIITNGKFTGIKMSQPWNQETRFFLRCIKKPPSFKERLNPIRKTTSIKIDFLSPSSGTYPAVLFFLNRDDNNFLTNLECVGLNRENPNRNSMWYAELIPGKGLKVVGGDRGVSFDALDEKLNPFQLDIDGDLLFPWVYFDPYQENQRQEEIEKIEANDFDNIGRGGELEFNTNLNNKGILNVSTLSTYFSAIETDIRICSFYDKTFNETYILHNINGFIELQKAKSDFKDKNDAVLLIKSDNENSSEDSSTMSYDINTYTAKTEKTIFLGKSILNKDIVMRSLTDSTPKTLKTRLIDNNIVEFQPSNSRWIIDLVKTISENHFIEGIEIEATIPSNGDDLLSNSAFVTISYNSTQGASSEEYYGYTYGFLHKDVYGNETIKKPQEFILKNGNNKISCPCLYKPQSIFINLVFPKLLTQEQFDIYKNTISNIDIKVIGLYILTEHKVPKPLAMSATISNDRNINVFYNSKFTYMANGEQIQPINFEDASITQYIKSSDSGDTWTFPNLTENTNIKMSEFSNKKYQEELLRLKESGYNDEQCKVLVQDERKWDISMILNSMRSPQVIISKTDDSSFVFGLYRSGTQYSATCWKINNSLLKSAFLPYDIEQHATDGYIARSATDLLNNDKSGNRLIASGLSKQQLCSVYLNSGYLIVLYEDALQNIKIKVSHTDTSLWKELPLDLFGSESKFNECKNISLIYDEINRKIYFFGLKSIGSDYHLYSISIEETFFSRIINLDIGSKEVTEIKEKINQMPKVLVVGNPNDLLPIDYEPEDISTPPKTIIGNSIKNKEGNFIILKPYSIDKDESQWDTENPTHISYSLDENIKMLHYVHGYVDTKGNIRVFYLNNVLNKNTIACKVSQDGGQTWQVDLLV